jgi:glycosyltransferase involved in cell wall biosynthesis/FMN phosphatase YigB (HAD superfamily)
MPAISVIIPSFNHARYIDQAIDSVLRQSFHDWELIIIDDASEDDSWDIIGNYEDERIRTLRHDANQGAHHTINEGLGLAQGDYLTILNSDDCYTPERLQRLYQQATEDDIDFLAARVLPIAADGTPLDDPNSHWNLWYAGLLDAYRVNNRLLTALCKGNLLITTSNFFFHRRIFDKQGGFADYRYVHDYEYVLRLILSGYKAKLLVDEALVHYRMHDANTIQENPAAAVIETIRLVSESIPGILSHCQEDRETNLSLIEQQLAWLGDNLQAALAQLRAAHRQSLDLLNGQLRQKNEAMTELRRVHQRQVSEIYASKSYRLGNRLIRPIHRLRNLAARVRNRKAHRILDMEQTRAIILAKRDGLKCVSFDIFDTLLARVIEPPEAVQRAVCREVAKLLGAGHTEESVWTARQSAEQALRTASWETHGDGECHFDDLVRDWVGALDGDIPADRLVEAIHEIEVELECLALYVKPEVVELLQWIRQLGLKVIATSDMYLGERHIGEILGAKGLLDHLDELHVSSESGLCKHSGKLFQHILAAHDWHPHELLHIGDNPISDSQALLAQGGTGLHLHERHELKRRAHQTLHHEMCRYGGPWPGMWFSQVFDALMSQREEESEAGFFYGYGRRRLGPLFNIYMAGLIEAIRRDGVDRLYFVARDGFIFQQLYSMWKDDDCPRGDYLYASRKTIMAASISDGMTLDQARIALFNPKQQGLLSILKTFGLDANEFEQLARRHGFETMDKPLEDHLDRRLRDFLDDPQVQERIRAYGMQCRERLERYLEQLGFFTHKSVAFVDIGWNGTIQKYLKSAFGHRPDFPKMSGYYFAFVGKIHKEFGEDNKVHGLLYDANTDPEALKTAAEFEELFEQGARSLQATTIGYEDDGGIISPLLKSDESSDRVEEIQCNGSIEQIHAGVLSGTRAFIDACRLTGLGFEQLRPYGFALLERAIIYPTKDEIEHITGLAHSEDFGHENILSLKSPPIRPGGVLFHPRAVWHNLLNAPWKAAMFADLPGNIWNFMFRILKVVRHS